MELNPNDIFQLAATIWEATLGIQIEAVSSQPPSSKRRSTAACIQITGAWNGAILLDTPDSVARRAASAMFNTDASKVQVTDLQDAVAELVNMVGGNVKALLPETCYLSLPAVVEGGDYSTRVPGSQVLTRVFFSSEGESVTISIVEKVKPQTAAA